MSSTEQRRLPRWLRALARLAVLVLVAPLAGAVVVALFIAVVRLRLPEVGGLASGPPPTTAFMHASGCPHPEVLPVPRSAIDDTLVCAVVWAEDRRFFHHDGVDWISLRAALTEVWRTRRFAVGASTLPMQLAKNLFLSSAKAPSRKLREIFLAERLVATLGRERVLELYLNIAEWAPCIYGAEAAARHYFGHGAAALAPEEAALLAALLPRPGHPPASSEGDRSALARRTHQLISLLGHGRVVAGDAVREGHAGVVAALERAAQGAAARSPTGAADPGGQRRSLAAADAIARRCGTTRSGAVDRGR